jgi:hypothetical protein
MIKLYMQLPNRPLSVFEGSDSDRLVEQATQVLKDLGLDLEEYGVPNLEDRSFYLGLAMEGGPPSDSNSFDLEVEVEEGEVSYRWEW